MVIVFFLLSGCSRAVNETPTETAVLPLTTPTASDPDSVTPTSTAVPKATASATLPLPTATFPPTITPVPPTIPAPLNVEITVEANAAGQAFSPLMLGSNLPNWLGHDQFYDDQFHRRVAASGITLLRIPGGSFGDEYGWLTCEIGENVPGAIPCTRDWVMRPTDFINFFNSVAAYGADIEPMFIINVNATAQEAAAAVAFFNAEVGDPTPIGVDRNGVDWKTAGEWAALRAANGNPEPLGIRYWDIGNEVYGGKPGNPGCGGNGWEQTWTCLGNEYMLGTAEHDGFIEIRHAMQSVDASILVGAVGLGDVGLWNDGVLASGTDQIDYFIVHTYPAYSVTSHPTAEQAEILARPQDHWWRLVRNVGFSLNAHPGAADLPLVINEYGIVPQWGQIDTRNYMNKHATALFFADSIGQMIVEGVSMAAQWDVMNGRSDDYSNEFGLMYADGSNLRQPKYYVYPLWARFGTTMLPVEFSADPETQLSVYAGRLEDGVITLLVVNKHGAPVTGQIALEGVSTITAGLADVLSAEMLDADIAAFNGNTDPADDLSDAPAAVLQGVDNNTLEYTFAPISVTLLRLSAEK